VGSAPVGLVIERPRLDDLNGRFLRLPRSTINTWETTNFYPPTNALFLFGRLISAVDKQPQHNNPLPLSIDIDHTSQSTIATIVEPPTTTTTFTSDMQQQREGEGGWTGRYCEEFKANVKSGGRLFYLFERDPTFAYAQLCGAYTDQSCKIEGFKVCFELEIIVVTLKNGYANHRQDHDS
jgi:hypothetical protein